MACWGAITWHILNSPHTLTDCAREVNRFGIQAVVFALSWINNV